MGPPPLPITYQELGDEPNPKGSESGAIHVSQLVENPLLVKRRSHLHGWMSKGKEGRPGPLFAQKVSLESWIVLKEVVDT